MPNRGWQGDPPKDDDAARARIIAAAMRCLDRQGPADTSLADVATELGVTRQTIYRLYAGTEALLFAVAETAAGSFVDRMVSHTRALAGPADMLVEALAFTLERLPHERYLSLLFIPGRRATFTRNITSAVAFDLTDQLLTKLPVDWASYGVGRGERDLLIEIWLRTLQSFAQDPQGVGTATDIRGLLHAWLAPAVRSVLEHASAGGTSRAV